MGEEVLADSADTQHVASPSPDLAAADSNPSTRPSTSEAFTRPSTVAEDEERKPSLLMPRKLSSFGAGVLPVMQMLEHVKANGTRRQSVARAMTMTPTVVKARREEGEGDEHGDEADDDEGVPTYVQWRTKCLGIETVGLPAGSLYFNAKIVRDGDRCTLEAGRLTVKEEIGVNTPLFPTARGILAEFKIVGTFEARPRAAVAAPGS